MSESGPFRLTRRRFLGGAAGALAAGGCARRAGRPAGESTREAALIRLSTVSSNYKEGFQQLAEEYQTLHPETRVRVEILPSNGYETWLRTQIPSLSPEAPDLFNANFAWGFYERGLLANLTPFLDRTNPYTGEPWRATLNPTYLELLKQGGDTVIIPLDFIGTAFYYNRDLFDALGLQPPRTWEEMLGQAGRLRAAGAIPFAVPGDAESYWSGIVGWFARFFSDAYLRHLVPLVMARPGDWNWDPARNAGWTMDLDDPFNDGLVVLNNERLLRAIEARQIRFDGPRFREIYTHIRQFSHHWQRGFHGSDGQAAYHLFLSGKAAILMNTSALVSQLLYDMEDLPESARFRWDLFPVPPLVTSRFRIPSFRSPSGAGVVLAVVNKEETQVRRVVDFLMYLTTPHAARTLVERAVANRKALIGPMLVPGAELPGNLRHAFRVFLGRGTEKLTFRGLMDEQQSIWEWTVWAQRYMEGAVSLDTFLNRYQRLMEAAVPRIVEAQGLDMDPRTRDREPG